MILWRHFLPKYQQKISAVIKSSQLDWENQQSLAYFHNKKASIVYRILINHKSSYATFDTPWVHVHSMNELWKNFWSNFLIAALFSSPCLLMSLNSHINQSIKFVFIFCRQPPFQDSPRRSKLLLHWIEGKCQKVVGPQPWI